MKLTSNFRAYEQDYGSLLSRKDEDVPEEIVVLRDPMYKWLYEGLSPGFLTHCMYKYGLIDVLTGTLDLRNLAKT